MKNSTTIVILAVIIGACGGAEPAPTGSVSGRLVSGPHCAAESNPPDPTCADRPVPGAIVVASTADGTEIEAVSDDEGRFTLELPEGEITITFQTVEGLMGTPLPATVSVAEGSSLDLEDIAYDTGIR